MPLRVHVSRRESRKLADYAARRRRLVDEQGPAARLAAAVWRARAVTALQTDSTVGYGRRFAHTRRSLSHALAVRSVLDNFDDPLSEEDIKRLKSSNLFLSRALDGELVFADFASFILMLEKVRCSVLRRRCPILQTVSSLTPPLRPDPL